MTAPTPSLAAHPSGRRFRPLFALALLAIAVSTLTRGGLLLATPGARDAGPAGWAWAFGAGLGYDLLAVLALGLPLMLWIAVVPRHGFARRRWRWPLQAGLASGVGLLLFVALAEAVFWEEFQARFNFIAVDYLVYTTEVIGNIRESYPVGMLLSGLAAMTATLFALGRRWRDVAHDDTPGRGRLLLAAGWIAALAAGTATVDGAMKDRSGNTYIDELAGNGIYQFFAAYRTASLDYERYYRQMPLPDAFATTRSALAEPSARFLDAQGVERRITPHRPARRLNVVLVSIESLSAEYSGLYGRSPSLTPNLDALTSSSLVFDRLYASGTRTVRGLEALSLAVPTTPGESIVKRPDARGLATLATVFNAQGYRSMFLYGGYGAFDQMNAFFGANGYEVHDRTDIPDDAIHNENVWGVADEDLYTMAMAQFDRAQVEGRPFFAHIMTTSNHRPYTFPAGRGPWPQGKRESAVAYTDWAVADFLRRAASRPWFEDTVFVITADHCASSGGLADLPVFRYHIPLWIHAPKHVEPGRYDRMMAQVDIAPTVLGLLGMGFDSPFYGVDVLARPDAPERAYIGTYQRLGYLTPDRLVELSPNQGLRTVRPEWARDVPQPDVPDDARDTAIAIGAYQSAAWRYAHGRMAADGPHPARP